MALSDKGNFIIDGKEFKPKAIKVIYDSVAASNSGRDDSGKMHIKWVRRCIVRLEIEFPPCKVKEAHDIMKLVQGQFYDITYWDPRENKEITSHVYTSTSNADWYSGVLYNGLMNGVSFNAIEV